MSRFVFKLPDLGEGTVEAEIVAWRVKPGDLVKEEDTIAEVMTEKAVVELPAPVSGKVLTISGQAGDRVAVGADLIAFETDGEAKAEPASATATAAKPEAAAPTQAEPGVARAHASPAEAQAATPPVRTGRVLTSPAIRRKARESGIDLAVVAGSGHNGRITHKDIDTVIAGKGTGGAAATRPKTEEPVEEIKVIGLRRVIAQRMVEAKRSIPHFAYVEEVDITELEEARRYLNQSRAKGEPLTYLPFLVLALVKALRQFPECNALYDSERGVIRQFRAVHVGIATQTPDGLKVPVVRDAQAKTLTEVAAEIRRVSEAARTNKATREELSGSTITVSSLGKLGGIASTPIINSPEVAILGVNRAVERAVVRSGAITVRRMMNLSSSFDHRFIDGQVAAGLVQAMKELLEHPTTIFVD